MDLLVEKHTGLGVGITDGEETDAIERYLLTIPIVGIFDR